MKSSSSPEISLSVVCPVFNEKESLPELYQRLNKVLRGLDLSYEIIFIDDGSTDDSFSVLKRLSKKDEKVRVIQFRRNFGQTAALDAGFKFSSGNIIVSLDADLQNDPRDIPELIKKLGKGFDCVSGWRHNRKDSYFKKTFSKVANWMRHFLIDDKIHDSGCTLKAYRRECIQNLQLYGEMHRYIPALLKIQGFEVTELKIRHNLRKYGKTKYSTKRVIKGFIDLLAVWFWKRYSSRPLHLFGFLGLFIGALGFAINLYLMIIKFVFGRPIGNRPLLILGVLLIVLAVQFLVFGVLSDIMIRMYYREKKNYKIKRVLK